MDSKQVDVLVGDRIPSMVDDLEWFCGSAELLHAPSSGVTRGLKHWDSVIDAITSTGMTDLWHDEWIKDALEDQHYGEAHPDLHDALPAFPRISVLRDHPLFVWRGFFTMVECGRARSMNLAFLQPDSIGDFKTKPVQYRPVVIGVTYAITTAGGEGDNADGIIALIIPGPSRSRKNISLAVVWMTRSNGLVRGTVKHLLDWAVRY
jgi:hypothetical protein